MYTKLKLPPTLSNKNSKKIKVQSFPKVEFSDEVMKEMKMEIKMKEKLTQLQTEKRAAKSHLN